MADLLDVTDVCAGYLESLKDFNFFHAGMALLYALWEQMKAQGCRHSQWTLSHRAEALSAVRRKLSCGCLVDDVTLCALLFLAMLEVWLLSFSISDC